jgi:hypothetical protein
LRHLGGVYVMASGESFSDAQIANPWFTENVPVISLDHLHANQGRYSRQLVLDKIFEGVDLLKIDVEGFEESVLKGMSEIIRTYRPTAIVEILEEAKVPEIHALFGNDYEVFHVVERDGSLSRVEGGPNKLFIHRDRTHLLSDYGSDS